jgi:hypothetical protein
MSIFLGSFSSLTNAIEVMDAELVAGRPISCFECVAKGLMINGTLYGVVMPQMAGETFDDWTDRITEISEDHLRIHSNITLYNIEFEQTDPWYITVHADVNIQTNYSGIEYRISGQLTTNVSIVGYEDPIFAMYGHDRRITRSDTAIFNETKVIEQIQGQTYKHSSLAPSFIMRMENNTNASDCCGIISLIDSSDTVTFAARNYSYIDYIYFEKRNFCPFHLFNITKVWSHASGDGHNFKIDSTYLYDYGFHDDRIENVTLVTC